MKARVWGCRGSLAAPGADTIRYGGNTSCVEVRLHSGPRLVLDAGTGMRALGVAIDRQPVDEVHVLLTHLHLDHLQGLGFFRPLFRPGVDMHVWGPASPVQSLAHRIAIYLSPPLFPVRLADIPARVTFHDAPEKPVTIGSATVRAAKVTHQGPTVGYRIEENGRTLVFLPDHEPSIGVHLADEPRSGSAATTLPTKRTCCSTTRNTVTTSTRNTLGGVTPALSRSWASRTKPLPTRWSSSITTPITSTRRSTRYSSTRESGGTAPPSRSALPAKA
jgi:ribonuclease BN (tRNA processing enzyme)